MDLPDSSDTEADVIRCPYGVHASQLAPEIAGTNFPQLTLSASRRRNHDDFAAGGGPRLRAKGDLLPYGDPQAGKRSAVSREASRVEPGAAAFQDHMSGLRRYRDEYPVRRSS